MQLRVSSSACAILLLGAVGCSTQETAAPNTDASGATYAGRCASLADTTIGNGKVEEALYLDKGDRIPVEGVLAPFASWIKADVAVCRLRIRVNPAPGSSVLSEIWLPDHWNEKMLAVGGGGFSGGFEMAAITVKPALKLGYAAAASDAGHVASDGAKWAFGQPEKIIDYGHRGNHTTAIITKAVIASYYGQPTKRAYFHGCSNGGRDALMEARRYPDDYDAIIAGAPAADWPALASSFVWNYQTIQLAPGARGLRGKLKIVNDAIVAKCDAIDGVKDGVLENPALCRFDPAELQCKGAGAARCLTTPELGALRKIYEGPKFANGQQQFPGYPLGSEVNAAWANGGKGGTAMDFGVEMFRWMVYKDAAWTMDKFQLDRDYPLVNEQLGPILSSADPDLRAFTAKGGKLILYHGWNDSLIPAQATINYYDAVRARVGSASDQIRLFMAPGLDHCVGGAGAGSFDMLPVIDRWVETGKAPERVIAWKPENALFALAGIPTKSLRTRPLCVWPQTARYTGTGSTDEEANFVCTAPN